MKTSAWGCGCFVKVYVCSMHLSDVRTEMMEMLEETLDQLELQLGTKVAHEVHEDGDADGEARVLAAHIVHRRGH